MEELRSENAWKEREPIGNVKHLKSWVFALKERLARACKLVRSSGIIDCQSSSAGRNECNERWRRGKQNSKILTTSCHFLPVEPTDLLCRRTETRKASRWSVNISSS